MHSLPRQWTMLGMLLALCGVTGCATMHLPWERDQFPKATAQNPVVQIVCLWEQAEGRDPDGLPCRGFAGQILFLANRNATPVEVDGDVRIYLFDDVGTVDEQAKPLRQYDFSGDAWKMHLTKSAVGPSYSVFVPYVRRGQQNAQCSLRVQLAPKDGPRIFSELSSLPLRGPATTPESTMISQPAAPEDRLQSEVHQTLSQMMQKSSSIPISVNHQGTLTIAQQDHRTEQSTPAASLPQSEDRLTRMERLLETVLAERSGSGERGEIQPAHYEEPAQEPAPQRRFKLSRSDEQE